jgi:putative colanic acid biosynthesis UDP-glucose lipid carrier transferase
MLNGHFRIGLKTGALIVAQTLVAPVICVATLVVAARLHEVAFTDAYIALAIVAPLLCYLFLRPYLAGDWGTFTGAWTIARRVGLTWIAVVGVLLMLGYATKFSELFSRRVLFTWFLITPPVTAGALIVLRQRLRQAVIRGGMARSAVIVGVNEVSRRLARNIKERRELGLTFKGFFDDRGSERLGSVDRSEFLGRLTDIPAYVKLHRVDCIFVAIPVSYVERTKALMDELKDTTASLYFVPDIFVFDLIQARVDDVSGIPVVALCETPFFGGKGLIKRASDIVLASLMLILALPAMILIVAAVKLSSPGTIIFKQRRYGLDGQEITVYKFRTMRVSEDGQTVVQATRNDLRVTPVGRFLRRYSLDELPQLINVLQGRMSVVGPRPHAIVHNEEYRKVIDGYMIRHKVTPGITGLAQVNGCRGETATVEDMRKRIHYDLEYLRRWSLLLDLKILLRTVAIWFRDERAY